MVEKGSDTYTTERERKDIINSISVREEKTLEFVWRFDLVA
jgi:hypothetical protein